MAGQAVQVGQVGNYKIIQLISGMGFDTQPQISGNKVVWSASNGSTNEIFMYDGINVSQLTNNNIADTNPQISGNKVVWEGAVDALNTEIFLYDGNTTTQLTNNNVHDFDPKISGDNIIWQNGTRTNNEIFFYNGSNITQLTDQTTFDREAQISGNKVVWQRPVGIGLDGEIYQYEGNSIISLTGDNRNNDANPQISGDNVVWETTDINRNDGNESGIYLFNGSVPILLSSNTDPIDSNPIINRNPQISGSNVVWQSIRAGDPNADSEIYFYNGRIPFQLTDNNITDIDPQISGGKVVWRAGGDRGVDGDGEIYLYDGNEIVKLTDNSTGEFNHKISENNIVWSSGSSSLSADKVFLATPIFNPTPPPLPPPPSDRTPFISIDRWWATKEDNPITVNVTVEIPTTGNYTFSVDTEGLLSSQWQLTNGATVTVDSGSPLSLSGVTNLGSLTPGFHTLKINGFEVPQESAIEEIEFKLESDSLTEDLQLNALFVADEVEVYQDRLYPVRIDDRLLAFNSADELVDHFAPILNFNRDERYAVPFDLNQIWSQGQIITGDSGEYFDNLSSYANGRYVNPEIGGIYASILEANVDGNDELAINYYFYYPRSNWQEYGGYNTHEGDWEGITLFLKFNAEGEWVPDRVAFAQHEELGFLGSLQSFFPLTDGGQIVPWSCLNRNGDRTAVYVGLGGHASYSYPGTTSWTTPTDEIRDGGVSIPPTQERAEDHRGDLHTFTPTNNQVHYLPRAGILNQADPNAWLLFPGRWGNPDLDNDGSQQDGDKAPRGPIFLDTTRNVFSSGIGERWLDPWAWSDGFDTIESIAIIGSEKNDSLNGCDEDDTLFGGLGNDSLQGHKGDDIFNGNQGNDILSGGEGDDFIRGGKDDDLLLGQLGDDSLLGDLGNDTVSGAEGDDLVRGGQGDDFLADDLGEDTLFGDMGNDYLFGGEDNDTLNGNQNEDLVYGGRGNDLIRGGKGNDVLLGHYGNDFLWGDFDDDYLSAYNGNDTLIGGAGNDTLDGGEPLQGIMNIGNEDRDIFVLAPGMGEETIINFSANEDLLGLTGNLTFEQLNITQGSGEQALNALISIAASGELLAKLTSFDASLIKSTMFVQVTGI